MKNTMSLLVLAMALLLVGFVNAGDDIEGWSDTTITGIITDASDNIVVGANVTINCGGNILSADSKANGQYFIYYYNGDCPLLSQFSITAEKDGQLGSDIGTVAHEQVDFNLGIASIQIVPEFGAVIGMLTILSAVGIFFVVRKD